MAYVALENLSFQYPDAAAFALRGVSLKAGTVLQNCPPEGTEVSIQAHR